jgi:AsmA protein
MDSTRVVRNDPHRASGFHAGWAARTRTVVFELMSRRSILVVALACLALLALAVAPWTVTTSGLATAVSRQLRSVYGLDLTVRGRSTVAFLPVPRLKFEDVSLGLPGRPPLIEAAQLRGDIRVWPLLLGNVWFGELALHDARIKIDIAEDGATDWAPILTRQRDRIDGQKAANRHVRRLIMANASLLLTDRQRGRDLRLQDINLVANWPALDSSVDVTASVRWRGEPVQLTVSGLLPLALVQGGKDRFAFEALSGASRLNLDLEASFGDGLRATGRANFATKGLRDLLHWSGLELPFGGLVSAAGLGGDFTLDEKGVSFPAVQLTMGSDRLDGALSLHFDRGRLGMTGTLAAERLDLSGAPAPFGPLLSSGGYWSYERLNLSDMGSADLDLRISAANARVGPLRLDDVAANVLVKPGRIEIALGRATLNKGTIKGRLALAPGPETHDLKLQGSFDRVDLGAFLTDIGHTRWISGAAQGQINLEALGDSPAEILRRMQGRAAVNVRQGDLWGVALAEALRRIERRPLSAPLEWKGGRTPFDQANIVLNVHAGVGDVLEATLTGAAARAGAQGRVSLAERALALKATVESVGNPGATPGPSLVFDIQGPWSDIAVVPDARTLIQRSGAARQLFTSEPRGEDAARMGAHPPAE